MELQAIIFDFDGVLINSETIHHKAVNLVLQRFNTSVSTQDYFQHYVGFSDYDIFSRILEKLQIPMNQQDLLSLIREKQQAVINVIHHGDNLDSHLDARDFIETYHPLIPSMAICSGASRSEIDAILKILDHGQLQQYFKVIVSIDDVTTGKPSPEGYLLAASKLGVDPKHCLVIEDTLTGATAGKRAGMQVALIDMQDNQNAADKVDIVVKSFKEIEVNK